MCSDINNPTDEIAKYRLHLGSNRAVEFAEFAKLLIQKMKHDKYRLHLGSNRVVEFANTEDEACCIIAAMRIQPSDPREIPIEILHIKGKRHIFQIHCSSSTGKGSCDFAVDDILDRPATSEHASSSEKNHPRFPSLRKNYIAVVMDSDGLRMLQMFMLQHMLRMSMFQTADIFAAEARITRGQTVEVFVFFHVSKTRSDVKCLTESEPGVGSYRLLTLRNFHTPPNIEWKFCYDIKTGKRDLKVKKERYMFDDEEDDT
ncbi:nucleic acid-binding, OB-fold protein [Tanacetum coccineum]